MKDPKLKQFLLEKESLQLTDDFDSNMMLIINKQASKRVNEKRYIKLMYLFFLLGLMLGFVIAITLVDTEISLGDTAFTINKLILQIPLVIALLFLFEKIYKATLVRRGKEEFTNL